MGLTFSAIINSNNIVKVTANPGMGPSANPGMGASANPGMGASPTVKQSDLILTQQLETLINQYGFSTITIDQNQLETYIKNKVDSNITYIQSIKSSTNLINENLIFSQSPTIHVIPNLLMSVGIIYMTADQFLLIPIVKPIDGEQKMSLIIPNFFFNSNVINNLNAILIGFNPTLPQQLLPKINAIYNVFHNSLNPQLSFINLISIGILSSFINILGNPRISAPTNQADTLLFLAIASDIALDILNIQVNGNNNCIITSKILTFNNSICNLQSLASSRPPQASCPPKASCPPQASCPQKESCPPQSNTILYISFATIIILIIILMIIIYLFMGKN